MRKSLMPAAKVTVLLSARANCPEDPIRYCSAVAVVPTLEDQAVFVLLKVTRLSMTSAFPPSNRSSLGLTHRADVAPSSVTWAALA